jgi:hypothetical protein
MRILILLIIIFIGINTQLIDYCSNDTALNNSKNLCLSIYGCCYTDIASKENSLTSCFKKYKETSKETCEDYQTITKLFGNVVKECQCNDGI